MQKKYDHEFFQNLDCEYFPCHKTDDPDSFNCHFCYCPLYALDDECGGNFKYNKKGIKDCTDCLRPHVPYPDGDFYAGVSKIINNIAGKHRQDNPDN